MIGIYFLVNYLNKEVNDKSPKLNYVNSTINELTNKRTSISSKFTDLKVKIIFNICFK
jgi:hypothetical protein